jgi:hypothetical protein
LRELYFSASRSSQVSGGTPRIEMLCFRVSHNDKVVCTAGIGDDGVLSTILSWVARRGKPRPAGATLHVGGLAEHVHSSWVDGFERINLGDEVIIALVDAEPDPPLETKLSDAASVSEDGTGARLRCSFCRRPTPDDRIVTGPDVYICDECVTRASEMLREREID